MCAPRPVERVNQVLGLLTLRAWQRLQWAGRRDLIRTSRFWPQAASHDRYLGLILFVVVCAASIADSDGASSIFHETEGRFPRLHSVLVDQGYKGWLVGFAKRWFGIIVDIVSRSPEQREFVVQPQRSPIERTFGWLDWSRILSKEYDRTTESSECDIYLASIRLMLRRLVSSLT
jgi:transposase